MSGIEQLDLAEAAFLARDYAAALAHARAALLAGLDLDASDSERGEYASKDQSSRAEQGFDPSAPTSSPGSRSTKLGQSGAALDSQIAAKNGV